MDSSGLEQVKVVGFYEHVMGFQVTRRCAKFIGGARMLEMTWISQALKMRPLDRLETSDTYYPKTRSHIPQQRRRQALLLKMWIRGNSKVLNSASLSIKLLL